MKKKSEEYTAVTHSTAKRLSHPKFIKKKKSENYTAVTHPMAKLVSPLVFCPPVPLST